MIWVADTDANVRIKSSSSGRKTREAIGILRNENREHSKEEQRERERDTL